MRPLCEILQPETKELEFQMLQETQVESILQKTFTKMPDTRLILLDLHDVTDTLSLEELNQLKMFKAPKIVISFVGWTTKTRDHARDQIQQLLDSKVIDFGFLVFTRRRNKTTDVCIEPGSKYWAVSVIMKTITPFKAIFYDDSVDHVKSVAKVPGVLSRNYNGNGLISCLKHFLED